MVTSWLIKDAHVKFQLNSVKRQSPWDRGQTYIKLGTKHVVTKVSKFYVEKYLDYILTGLKVSSLVCKCVFYRPKHNAKEGHQWDWIYSNSSNYHLYSQSYGH